MKTEDIITIIFVLILLTILFTIFILGTNATNKMDNFCKKIGYKTSEYIGNGHFNCCEQNIVKENGTYVNKKECIAGE